MVQIFLSYTYSCCTCFSPIRTLIATADLALSGSNQASCCCLACACMRACMHTCRQCPLVLLTCCSILADILRVMPSKAIELTAFDAYKKLLSHEGEDGKLKRPGPLLTALAGAAAGNISTSSSCCHACIGVLGASGCLHPHLNSNDTVGWRVLGQLCMPCVLEGPHRVSAGAASSLFGAENALAGSAPLASPTPTPSPGTSHFRMSEMLPPSPPTFPPPLPLPRPSSLPMLHPTLCVYFEHWL